MDTTPADALQIGYAANLNAADQQVVACCSCPLTPNHLKGVSVCAMIEADGSGYGVCKSCSVTSGVHGTRQ